MDSVGREVVRCGNYTRNRRVQKYRVAIFSVSSAYLTTKSMVYAFILLAYVKEKPSKEIQVTVDHKLSQVYAIRKSIPTVIEQSLLLLS